MRARSRAREAEPPTPLTTALARLRTTLFHHSARANLPVIERSRRLRPAAGTSHMSHTRRAESVVVGRGGRAIHVRDKRPLS